MRLPISVSLPASTSKEGASGSGFVVDPSSKQPMLVELQGALETDGGSTAGATIGQLDLSQPARPQLLISHHLLTGKVVTLDKPLAVLRHTFPPSAYGIAQPDESPPAKKTAPTSSPEAMRLLVPPKTPDGNGMIGGSSSPLPSSPATPMGVVELREGSQEIIGIIRTKLLFSSRPMNIVHLDAPT